MDWTPPEVDRIVAVQGVPARSISATDKVTRTCRPRAWRCPLVATWTRPAPDRRAGAFDYDTPAMTDDRATRSLATPYRSHTCGELRASDAGSAARLAGWVHRRRDHGQLIFLDLRDRHGLTQVVIDATEAPAAHKVASEVRNEFVVAVEGTVDRRMAGKENPELPTGEIELRARTVRILAEARTPPFYINEPDAQIDESAPAQVPLSRYPAPADGRAAAPPVPARPGGPRDPPRQRLRRGRDADARSRARRRAPATSSCPSRLQPGSVYALPQ